MMRKLLVAFALSGAKGDLWKDVIEIQDVEWEFNSTPEQRAELIRAKMEIVAYSLADAVRKRLELEAAITDVLPAKNPRRP